MSEQDGTQRTALQRPASDDKEAWKAYWKTQGQEWRTQPEIDAERQKYLAERRTTTPDVEHGTYPFKDIKLNRADVEWLLATHEHGRGPVDWSDESQRTRQGLDLRGADLRKVDLTKLPLTHVRGGLGWGELYKGYTETSKLRHMAKIHLEGADLSEAHLESAYLYDARLQEAFLWKAYLQNAQLADAHLEGANLREAHLEGAFLAPFAVTKDIVGENSENNETPKKEDDSKDTDSEGVRINYVRIRKTSFRQVRHGTGITPFMMSPEVIDFDGAHLEFADLSEVHLEGAHLIGAHLESASLVDAHLEGASFREAHLEGASLEGANLAGTHFNNAHLEGTNLENAHLEGKEIPADILQDLRKWMKNFPMTLPPADMQGVFFNNATNLRNAALGDTKFGSLSLADVCWEGANLAVVDWSRIKVLGDEREARQYKTIRNDKEAKAKLLDKYRVAVRANRQLAVVLRDQGLNEEADHFAYHAQKLQRIVLRRQKKFGRYLFFGFLDLLAGHGYRPERSVFWYLFVIISFATAYSILGHLPLLPDTLVFSIMSFHGRGFFPNLSGETALHNPLVVLAAAEAIIGLLIEISFIATFTQRFL